MATPAAMAAAIHTEIGGGTYHSPPTPPHNLLLHVMRANGIVNASGDYLAGRGVADVERLLQVPTIGWDIAMRAAVASGH